MENENALYDALEWANDKDILEGCSSLKAEKVKRKK